MRRRHFLLAATATLAAQTTPLWADIGDALFLTAGNTPDNATWLVGLTASGDIRFKLPLPGRGHAAAAHPHAAVAVAFARRPGTFAIVLNCATGDTVAKLTTPAGHHFYGHGAFTSDGRYLLTTENAYDIPDGRIGIWDTEQGYARVGDVPSGGIGPHEIIRLASGDFAVANGGIQTHPDFARSKLNLPTMRTNLARLSATGTILSKIELSGEMRQNSIRHIAAAADNTVVAALQWQGPPTKSAPLIAHFAPGREAALLDHPATARLNHYAGSVAINASGTQTAVTGPKGGHVLFLNASGAPSDSPLSSASGVARHKDGLLITCKGGLALYHDGALMRIAIPARGVGITISWP
ncbi:DUF1513 domain-containing protein [Shimia abyssi]|uniref:DUF1513 domain-containing protein n=1 Tax=Shimia abyssi TaxID=1662395 RepID=A0A2P8FGT0_9RHOB|nr:DUF1513 domain-containing protein [Shimia abyssi]PSL20907.1 hypothetical protein CLV88_10224 [Shimia abyssi]